MLLLACFFEEFRSVCYKAYGLDCCFHYSASNLSGDAFLKICKADLELLTNREHLEMAENLLRGGVSSIYEKRFERANNQFVPGFDASQELIFMFMLDANNLYGGIMQTESLPLNDFKMNLDISLDDILRTPADSSVGYIVEVDLLYPEECHDLHCDYHLAPTKETVQLGCLSGYQTAIRDK